MYIGSRDNWFRLGYFAAFVSLAGFVTSVEAQESNSHRGIVVDKVNNPISDVIIYRKIDERVLGISSSDGSFEIPLLSFHYQGSLVFRHLAFQEVSVSLVELNKNKGIVSMQESIKWLDAITVHPLSAKELFIVAVNKINRSTAPSLLNLLASWTFDTTTFKPKHASLLIDTLNLKELKIQFMDTLESIFYFDFFSSNAAMFNSENMNDYIFSYGNHDTDLPIYTQIKCVDRRVSGNEFWLTISNDDFSIVKIAFCYYWNPLPKMLSDDLRYWIESLFGETQYVKATHKLLSIAVTTSALIGEYDVLNQKFKPLIKVTKLMKAN